MVATKNSSAMITFGSVDLKMAFNYQGGRQQLSITSQTSSCFRMQLIQRNSFGIVTNLGLRKTYVCNTQRDVAKT